MRRPPFASVLALLAAALVLAASGCGGGEEVAPLPETVEGTVPQATTEESPASTLEGDAEAGEQVFGSAGCGGCHVLEAAGSSGTIGPSLDEVQPSFDVAVTTVTNGRGAMPAFQGQLTDQQIADVAQFVVDSTSG